MFAEALKTISVVDIPDAESDEWEFKCGGAKPKDLSKKLSCAASGLANSGGGVFVAGVDDNGNPDNGIPKQIGRQDLRDWVDQAIHRVEPAPKYDILLLEENDNRGTLKADHVVLAVAIEESYLGPHMAPDGKYYVRAGAHTVPARHFIVEAIWAKRHVAKPRLKHNWRFKPGNANVLQLGVVALTSAPAINVSLNLTDVGGSFASSRERFPLTIPVIDQANSFYLDATTWCNSTERLGDNPALKVTYNDLAGNEYSYETKVDPQEAISPVKIGEPDSAKIAKAMEKIAKTLQQRQ